MTKVKITVLKRFNPFKVFDTTPVPHTMTSACERFQDGQEFISENGGFPAEFPCAWAWHDIFPCVMHLWLGGDFPWVKEKGTTLSCCTDGFRPVIFKLERIEE